MSVWKYGDDINTDMLFPGKYTYTCSTSEEIKPHLLEDLDPTFATNVERGDLIFVGKNFGCGSSRERAATCIKDTGIACIIAPSYGRIFMRNAINIGLPILECDEAPDNISEGDVIEIDLAAGTILDLTNGRSCTASKFPRFLQSIVEAGGLVNYARRKVGKST